MFLLTILPEALIHIILIIGGLGIIFGFFISFIPFVNKYNIPIKILSILILSFGLYLEGGLAYKEKTAKEIAELKEKLANANAKAEKTNVKIVTKIVRDTKVVKVKGDEIIKVIEKEVEKFNNQCEIPKEVIELHNRAININAEEPKTINEPSKLKLTPRIGP